jgi:hypothetical protein
LTWVRKKFLTHGSGRPEIGDPGGSQVGKKKVTNFGMGVEDDCKSFRLRRPIDFPSKMPYFVKALRVSRLRYPLLSNINTKKEKRRKE